MTDNLPLVSIITPSYNQAAFLEQTIKSVLFQDYPAIEYVVIDGGSTDGSVEIIQRYTDIAPAQPAGPGQYAHQVDWWISEPDQGQADAINKGLRRAKGEIIAWLNSDDLYLPHSIQRAVQAMRDHPEASLVYGDALSIDQFGAPINLMTFADWGLVDLMSFRIICQPTVFIRRSALDAAHAPARAPQTGQTLDPNFHFMLDHLLWLQIVRQATSRQAEARQAALVYLPQVLAAARQHSGAKNIRQAAGFSQETGVILEWMQAEPELATLYRSHKRKILGGAYRLQARYLLDAGQPGQALKYYGRSFTASPRYASKHWRRMLYALATLANACHSGSLRSSTRQPVASMQRRKRLIARQAAAELQDWPGILLDEPPTGGQA